MKPLKSSQMLLLNNSHASLQKSNSNKANGFRYASLFLSSTFPVNSSKLQKLKKSFEKKRRIFCVFVRILDLLNRWTSFWIFCEAKPLRSKLFVFKSEWNEWIQKKRTECCFHEKLYKVSSFFSCSKKSAFHLRSFVFYNKRSQRSQIAKWRFVTLNVLYVVLWRAKEHLSQTASSWCTSPIKTHIGFTDPIRTNCQY